MNDPEVKAVCWRGDICYVIPYQTDPEAEAELIREATEALKRGEGATDEEISTIVLPELAPGLYYVPRTDPPQRGKW